MEMNGTARGALWTILALVVFFIADGLIFRTGWYNRYLEPDSSAGSLEAQLHWLKEAPAPRVPEILVIGDGEGLCTPCGGCRQRIREFASPETPIHVAGPQGVRARFTLEELLPHSFGPDNLKR